jgi:hypothetical protein
VDNKSGSTWTKQPRSVLMHNSDISLEELRTNTQNVHVYSLSSGRDLNPVRSEQKSRLSASPTRYPVPSTESRPQTTPVAYAFVMWAQCTVLWYHTALNVHTDSGIINYHVRLGWLQLRSFSIPFIRAFKQFGGTEIGNHHKPLTKHRKWKFSVSYPSNKLFFCNFITLYNPYKAALSVASFCIYRKFLCPYFYVLSLSICRF